MHDYAMLQNGDRVLVAVSGGVDSSVLACLLQFWRAKAPIDYTLKAVYIDNGFWKPEFGGTPPAQRISEMLAGFNIDFTAIKARQIDDKQRTCFLCARNRRSLLFDLVRDWNMDKIALGHHMDDLIETVFLNMIYSGNISTMVPKQKLFKGSLHLIRPLAYLEKSEVRSLADTANIIPVKNYCPIEKDTKRETVRAILAKLYKEEKGAKKSIFHSLSNIRSDYLL